MRIIIAARLSKDRQAQTGIESQDKFTTAWAQAQGHTIVAVVADKRSGTVQPWDRPHLKPWVTDQRLMAQYDAVVAYRLDRLSRGDNESTNEIEQWAFRNHKQLMTEDGLIFPCEGAEGIRWDVTKRFAHDEWLKSSERYRRMQTTLRKGDYHTGSIPFGYMSVPKNDHHMLEIDPETSKTLLQMIEWYLADTGSFNAIARRLMNQGVLTSKDWERQRRGQPIKGSSWTGDTVGVILTNEILIGRHYNGAGHIHKVPALISRETFAKILAKRDRGSRRYSVAKTTSLLTSVIRCNNCGGRMWKHPRENPVYRCDKPGEGSQQQSHCQNTLEMSYVNNWLHEQITSAPYGNLPVMQIVEVPGHAYQAELADNLSDIQSLNPDDSDYDMRLAELRETRKGLQALEPVPAMVKDYATGETVADRWQTLSTDMQRKYLIEAGALVYADKDSLRLEIAQPDKLQY